jgi:soluble lytic murein transglycosylase-like protein
MRFWGGRQNIALSKLHAQNGDDWARADPLYNARIGTEFLHHLRPHRFSGAISLIR